MSFGILSNADIYIISKKLTTGEYSSEYLKHIYGFSDDCILELLNMAYELQKNDMNGLAINEKRD